LPPPPAMAPDAPPPPVAPPPSNVAPPSVSSAPDTTEPAFSNLADVLQWSYVHNPSLRSARAAFKASEEALPQALSGWQPVVTATGLVGKTRVQGDKLGDGAFNKEGTAGFTQPLYRGGQTVAATGSARNAILAQRALLRDKEQQVLLQVATAYMNVFRDKALLKLSDNNVNDLAQQLKAAQDRFTVGDITKTDVSQAQAALSAAQADRTAALGNLRTSRAAYEQLIGFAPENLGYPVLHFPIPPTLDEAAAVADKENPQIAAATYLQKSSTYDVDRIFGQLLPELDLVGDVDRDYEPVPIGGPTATTETIGVSATVPLYEGGLIRSQVRQAKYTANQRYLDILDAQRQVRQALVTSWESLNATRAEIDSRKTQVEAAKIALDGIRQEANVGTRTVLDELNTEQDYLNAEVSLVTTQRDDIVATFALASNLGFLNPNVLGFPEIAQDDSTLDPSPKEPVPAQAVKPVK
jgi:outer membrane protein